MTEQNGNNKPNEAEGLAFPVSGNEKLIDSVRDWPTFTRMSHSTLEVAEKALTPTDDERGRSRGKYTDRQVLYMVLLALEEGLEGVPRQDLDDLLVKMIAEHWGTADEDTSPEEAEAAFAQLEPYIPDHMRIPEPQGEPSDARFQGIVAEVVVEAERSIAKHGEQRHLPMGTGADTRPLSARDVERGSMHGPGMWPGMSARHLARIATLETKSHSANEGGDDTCTWWHILREEVFEAAAESESGALREELVQVAAVAVKMIDALDAAGGEGR